MAGDHYPGRNYQQREGYGFVCTVDSSLKLSAKVLHYCKKETKHWSVLSSWSLQHWRNSGAAFSYQYSGLLECPENLLEKDTIRNTVLSRL